MLRIYPVALSLVPEVLALAESIAERDRALSNHIIGVLVRILHRR